MSQTIVILMPNGRRETVKVTPSSLLNPLFAELCKKWDFEPDAYVLKSSTGKLIDGTIPFRLTGIPNRAVLECSFCGRANSRRDVANIVDVCVQLPDGERVTVKVEDSSPLWDVIERVLEIKPGLLDEEDVEPCLSFMAHTFRGSQVLLDQTLKNCGISGRALLRFSFATRDFVSDAVSTELDFSSARNSVIYFDSRESRKSAKSTSHSRHEKSKHPSPQETVTERTTESSGNVDVISGRVFNNLPDKMPDFSWIPENPSHGSQAQRTETPMEYTSGSKFANFKFPDSKENEDECVYALQPMNESTRSTKPALDDRQVKVFSLNEMNFEVEDIPDNFFDVTVEDLKTMQKLRHREIQEMNEKPLLSGNSKKRKILQKYSNSTMIRILFPDKSALQAKFLLTETTHMLYSFVCDALPLNLRTNTDHFDFVLFTTPPRSEIVVSDVKTLLDSNLYPAVNVHFSSEKISSPPFLKSELLEQRISPNLVYNLPESNADASSARAGEAPSVSSLNTEKPSQSTAEVKCNAGNFSSDPPSNRSEVAKGAVPKWFTAGLKK